LRGTIARIRFLLRVMTKCASTVLLALMVSSAGVFAQDGAPSAAANPAPATSPAAGAEGRDASSVILAQRPREFIPAPPTDSDGVTRSVSAGVAAALAEGLPKYSPPTPTPTPEAEPKDLRDIDKPKNEIKRLPSYVVRESRPPIFRERDVNTTAGQIDLSFKSHPGLNFGNIFGLNSGPAYDMYLDDQRLENIKELTDIAHAMSRGGDAAEGTYILQQTQNTYMRTDDATNWGGPITGGGTMGGVGK
jgi:hypothetical protein